MGLIAVERGIELTGYPLTNPADHGWGISTEHAPGDSGVKVRIAADSDVEGIACGLFEIAAQVARRNPAMGDMMMDLLQDMWEHWKTERTGLYNYEQEESDERSSREKAS